MKKITSLLVAAIIATACLFSFSACSEVENSSRIQRMTMTLEYLDADANTVATRDVEIKLYLNFAPKTTAHFMELAQSGYYNGTVISNVQTNWVEFGAYKYTDGALTKMDYSGESIYGEFANNGWSGNTLLPTAGTLVMKRDYSLDTNEEPVYDTAKATVIINLNYNSKFSASEYCIFGAIDSTVESYKDDDGNSKSGLDVVKSFASYMTDDNGVKTYYNEITGKFYTTVYDSEESTTTYYSGAAVNDDNVMTGKELEDLQEDMHENAYAYLVLPYTQITIKSITKK